MKKELIAVGISIFTIIFLIGCTENLITNIKDYHNLDYSKVNYRLRADYITRGWGWGILPLLDLQSQPQSDLFLLHQDRLCFGVDHFE